MYFNKLRARKRNVFGVINVRKTAEKKLSFHCFRAGKEMKNFHFSFVRYHDEHMRKVQCEKVKEWVRERSLFASISHRMIACHEYQSVLLLREMSAWRNKSLVKLNICDCERVRSLVRAFISSIRLRSTSVRWPSLSWNTM